MTKTFRAEPACSDVSKVQENNLKNKLVQLIQTVFPYAQTRGNCFGLDFGEFGVCFVILGLFVPGFCGFFLENLQLTLKKEMRKPKMD